MIFDIASSNRYGCLVASKDHGNIHAPLCRVITFEDHRLEKAVLELYEEERRTTYSIIIREVPRHKLAPASLSIGPNMHIRRGVELACEVRIGKHVADDGVGVSVPDLV